MVLSKLLACLSLFKRVRAARGNKSKLSATEPYRQPCPVQVCMVTPLSHPMVFHSMSELWSVSRGKKWMVYLGQIIRHNNEANYLD